MLGEILLTFVMVVVGVNLVPIIADSVFGAQFNATGGAKNVSGAEGALLDLVPLFFVLSVLLVTIMSTLKILNSMGF